MIKAMKILPWLLETGANFLGRIPVEKMLMKPLDTKKDRSDLLDILHIKPAEPLPAPRVATGLIEPRRLSAPQESSGASEQETIDYQIREIGKLLLRMERHFAQKLTIAGIKCDCGGQKHLLDIEAMAEETIPMVEDSAVYYRLLEWVKKVGPVSTTEAAQSGRYDDMYVQFSHEARDFRKQIIGSLDPKALWPGHSVALDDLFKKMDEADRPKMLESPAVPALPAASTKTEGDASGREESAGG